jgi:hypothetical protein
MDYNPTLTEPGVKYFIGNTLKECRKFKESHSSMILNTSMTLCFIIVVSGFLFYRYKGKPSVEETALNTRKKQEYLISKLQQISIAKKKTSMITNLPIDDFNV